MRRAVEEARIEAEISIAAYQLVREQAVYALRGRGLSMRDIEDETGVPKSVAGRMAQEMEDGAGDPVEGHLTEPSEFLARIGRTVEAVWNRPPA